MDADMENQIMMDCDGNMRLLSFPILFLYLINFACLTGQIFGGRLAEIIKLFLTGIE